MKKIIKKIGKSIGVSFTQDEQKIYGIEPGKIFDIELVEEKDVKSNNRK